MIDALAGAVVGFAAGVAVVYWHRHLYESWRRVFRGRLRRP